MHPCKEGRTPAAGFGTPAFLSSLRIAASSGSNSEDLVLDGLDAAVGAAAGYCLASCRCAVPAAAAASLARCRALPAARRCCLVRPRVEGDIAALPIQEDRALDLAAPASAPASNLAMLDASEVTSR